MFDFPLKACFIWRYRGTRTRMESVLLLSMYENTVYSYTYASPKLWGEAIVTCSYNKNIFSWFTTYWDNGGNDGTAQFNTEDEVYNYIGFGY